MKSAKHVKMNRTSFVPQHFFKGLQQIGETEMLSSSAGPKGGPGGTCSPEEAVSVLKKTFFTHYMILRVYTVIHNLDDITALLKENVARGGTDKAVSVTRAGK